MLFNRPTILFFVSTSSKNFPPSSCSPHPTHPEEPHTVTVSLTRFSNPSPQDTLSRPPQPSLLNRSCSSRLHPPRPSPIPRPDFSVWELLTPTASVTPSLFFRLPPHSSSPPSCRLESFDGFTPNARPQSVQPSNRPGFVFVLIPPRFIFHNA